MTSHYDLFPSVKIVLPNPDLTIKNPPVPEVTISTKTRDLAAKLERWISCRGSCKTFCQN